MYKGHLLVAYQITESSRKRDKVYAIETILCRWMRQIKTVITQGHQIRRDHYNSGPINELNYWQEMLTRYSSITEFVTDKPFQNHLQCLILSRSKLVKQWKVLENQLSQALNESKDNVRYVSSMQRYWDPLYRCTPNEIIPHLPSLLLALRNVFKTSIFYNTSDCIASFLVKTTNQLTIAAKKFLTNNYTVKIFRQKPEIIIEKMGVSAFGKNKMAVVILYNSSFSFLDLYETFQ